jgi:hypothetical protein
MSQIFVTPCEICLESDDHDEAVPAGSNRFVGGVLSKLPLLLLLQQCMSTKTPTVMSLL